MNTGLGQADIDKIREVFRRHSGIESAILYGSRAKGTYREGSDIDLTLLGPSLNTEDLLAILNELDDLYLPYKFDVSIHHRINNAELLDHIARVGKEFYKKT